MYVVGCVVIYNIGIKRGIFCQIKMMMARGLLGEMMGACGEKHNKMVSVENVRKSFITSDF